MAADLMHYRTLTAIGWQGRILPANTRLSAVPDAKTDALLARGAIEADLSTVSESEQPLPPALLSALTVADLTGLAAAEGIELGGAKRKADIIALIEDHRNAVADAGAQPAGQGVPEGGE